MGNEQGKLSTKVKGKLKNFKEKIKNRRNSVRPAASANDGGENQPGAAHGAAA